MVARGRTESEIEICVKKDGQIAGERERKVELNIRQKMPKIFTKEILACQALVNVKFNGVRKLLGQSKFEGLTLFRDVNQERVDTMLVTVEH